MLRGLTRLQGRVGNVRLAGGRKQRFNRPQAVMSFLCKSLCTVPNPPWKSPDEEKQDNQRVQVSLFRHRHSSDPFFGDLTHSRLCFVFLPDTINSPFQHHVAWLSEIGEG